MTEPHRSLGAVDLQAVVWASEALVCVVADSTSTIVGANPAFARQTHGDPIGRPLAALVGEGQADAFESWLRGVGPAWQTRTWGVLPDANDLPRDFRVSACRRSDGAIVLIGERLMVDDVASALLDVNEAMLTEHRRLNRERGRLDRMTHEDALTGIANRRAFDMRLAAEVRGVGVDAAFAVVMLDLDHFKSLNDRYGHPIGDAVLRWLGGLLSTAARRSDFVARYGGEEFVVLLGGQLGEIKEVMERIRLQVEDRCSPGGDSPVRRQVTVSVGIAALTENVQTLEDLIETADEAMYRAKRAGKNRVAGSVEAA